MRTIAHPAAAAALLLPAIAGLWWRPASAFAGWLVAWLFCLQLALGAVSLLLVGTLVGGQWRDALRVPLIALAETTPLLLLLGLPLFAGLQWLYPWAQPERLALDPQLRAQSGYLNAGFAALRHAPIALLWCALAWRIARPLRRATAAGLAVLQLIALSVWSVDWIMSLVPEFRSTSFGLRAAVLQALGACALAIGVAAARADGAARRSAAALLLVLVLAWSYLALMAYVTVWTADLPPEIAWLLPRQRDGWGLVGVAIALLCGVLPFALLLSSALRGSPLLRWVAGPILAGAWLMALWQVLPVVAASTPATLAWALLTTGAFTLAMAVWRLPAARRPADA